MEEEEKTCGQTFADMWRYNAIVPPLLIFYIFQCTVDVSF